MTNIALIKGGSHRLSSALSRIILKNKGDILDGRDVKKIILKDGKASGVVLDDGKEIYSKIIVSTLNPQQTFLELIGDENLPKEISLSSKRWIWEKRSFFGLHLVFKEPVIFNTENNDVNNALICILGYVTEEILTSHIKQIEQGILPDEISGHITLTTLFDKSQAPDGMNVLRWESFAPYNIKIRNSKFEIRNLKGWDEIKDEYANKCIEKIRELTNIKKPVRIYPYTPLDIERKLTTMCEGSIKHGEYNPLQMGYFRPNDLCSSTKTPIDGLYVCGASVYPGGMITAGPGYNCANKIAEDLQIKKWWKEQDYIVQARNKKFVP